MNRASRRAGIALHRSGMRLPWQPFERVPESDNPALFARQRERVGDLLTFWKNNVVSVQVYRRMTDDGEALQLAVRRHDEEPIEGWSDLQGVKNEIVGEDRIAIEIYPREEDVMNQANRQTKGGVWGVMLSGWATPLTEPAQAVFSKWLTRDEAADLAADLIAPDEASMPNGKAEDT